MLDKIKSFFKKEPRRPEIKNVSEEDVKQGEKIMIFRELLTKKQNVLTKISTVKVKLEMAKSKFEADNPKPGSDKSKELLGEIERCNMALKEFFLEGRAIDKSVDDLTNKTLEEVTNERDYEDIAGLTNSD